MVQLTMVLRLFKKIIICFLALQLAFFSPFANANASPSGWTFSAFDAVAGIVSAVKNGAKATATVAKSPVSQKIAKGIAGGVIAGVALPLAISQITGIALESLDWVLDPANNAIKYRDKTKTPPDAGYYWVWSGVGDYIKDAQIYEKYAATTPEAACTKLAALYGREFGQVTNVTNKGAECWYKGSTSYDQGLKLAYYEPSSTATNDYQSIPIPTVANKIYDNAKTGHADSVSAVTTAVADLTKEGEYDTPLDLVKPEDKTCEAGYVKNSAGECVKDEQPKTCPAGSIKVGDTCI
ncbi:hypothetical protein CC462_23635, partial [Salmonella enterica subsp. enterica serovar Typhi]|nr:hypothetical protein [Salmonella enterica subsp. enterica serovar Typhi]